VIGREDFLYSFKDVRDAYEHIDERAAGNVWRKPTRMP